MHLRATFAHLLSLAALSWVHLVCLTRRGPNRRSAASRMLACLFAFALDVKTTADGQSYIRIDAE